MTYETVLPRNFPHAAKTPYTERKNKLHHNFHIFAYILILMNV